MKVVNDHEVSEISESELPIGYDNLLSPLEIIFAELGQGSYFGELSLHTDKKDS